MDKHTQMPTKLMVLIALLQGAALLFLHQAAEFKFWPYPHPNWLYSLYSVAIVAPTLFLLSVTEQSSKRLYIPMLVFSLIVALIGYYQGWQVLPESNPLDNLGIPVLTLALSVASFKFLMYLQQYSANESFDYPNLYQNSWRNFFIAALSFFFVGCFWSILVLWAELFKIVKIELFADLFEKPWFYYPATTLAFGFGVIIFRDLSKVIDIITRILRALLKFLLVVLALLAVLFMLALPYSGLEAIWQTGSGLILWLMLLTLFAVNAVYQSDAEARPYNKWLQWLIYAALFTLPIYAMIACYGISLRIMQYGWTIERFWAVVIWAILTLFAIGYCFGIALRKAHWLEHLAWVNVRMGLIVAAITLLSQTPLLDPRKITVNSQLARFSSGQVSKDDFDANYILRVGGKSGLNAIQALQQQYQSSDIAFAKRLSDAIDRRNKNWSGPTEEQFFAKFARQPSEIPTSLKRKLVEKYVTNAQPNLRANHYYLFQLDLDNNGIDDFVLLKDLGSYVKGELYYQVEDEWKTKYISHLNTELQTKELSEQLRNAPVSAQAPKWKNLRIGELVIEMPK